MILTWVRMPCDGWRNMEDLPLAGSCDAGDASDSENQMGNASSH